MDLINEILKWALAWILLWQAYILLFNRGVPNIKTAPACRKAIIARIKAEVAAKGLAAPMIYDLGSGNGNFTRQIAKDIPQARVIGYEISKLSLKRANAMRTVKGLENLKYRAEDFFEIDLSHADIIVFFLSAYEMGRLGEKLRENAKPGALILSNRFALHEWEPVEVLKVRTWLPKQGTIYVYQKEEA